MPDYDYILIESNPQDADLTTRSLRKYSLGKQNLHFKKINEAFTYFTNNRPNVKLLMIGMNKEVEETSRLVSYIKAKYNGALPIVVLASNNVEADMLKVYAAGASSCFIKPIAFADFLANISEIGLYWIVLNKCPSIK